MRQVLVSKRAQKKVQGANPSWFMEEIGEAVFHQFGTEYEELLNGVGQFTSGIVEWPDGRIEAFPLWCLRFIITKPQEL